MKKRRGIIRRIEKRDQVMRGIGSSDLRFGRNTTPYDGFFDGHILFPDRLPELFQFLRIEPVNGIEQPNDQRMILRLA